MFDLDYISLRNFRSHEEYLFQPLPPGTGITAIAGSNGAGKSSIVYALLWALYGKTPDGVTVSEIRRHGSKGDVDVRVGLRHQGQYITVSRQLRHPRDTTIASIHLDGVLVSESSARAASEWIHTRLGMDVDSFTTACVVRQKEIDQLMSLRPAERRKHIEKLAGIERLSTAVMQARTDARESQRIAEATTPHSDLHALQSRHDHAQQTLQSCQQDLTDIGQKRETLSTQLHTATEQHRHIQAEYHTIHELRTRLQHAVNMMESLHAVLMELPTSDSDVSVPELEELLAAATKELETAEHTYQESLLARERLAFLTEQLTAAQQQFRQREEHTESLLTQQRSLHDQLDTGNALDDDASALAEELAEQQAQLSDIRARMAHIVHALDTITQNPTAHQCPICQQSLVDAQHLLDNLHQEKEHLTSAEITTATAISSLHTRQRELTTQRQRHEELLSTLRHNAEALTTAKMNMREEAQRIGDIQQRIEQLTPILNAAPTEHPDLNRQKVQELQWRLREAKRAEHTARQQADTQNKLRALQDNERRIRAALENTDETTIDQRLRSQEEHLTNLRQEHTRLDTTYNTLLTQLDNHREHLTDLRASLDAALAEYERHQHATQHAEKLTHSARALETFRSERIAQLAPEISAVASTYLTDITENYFTDIVFDGEYHATITNHAGDHLTYAQLSGGESESVSLALRLAIADIVSSGEGGLVFLDEALTAQDATRRRLALQTLRRLNRQIIVINHAEPDYDLVDHIHALTAE